MLVVAAVAANLFLGAFGGTWSCTPHVPGVVSAPVSAWTIRAVPNSAWANVHWSTRSESGMAFVGYSPLEKLWIYDDFHSDGSFAANVAPPPVNGVWTWSGTFTTSQRITHGAVQWQRDRLGFRQSFGRLLGASFRETAFALCRPAKR